MAPAAVRQPSRTSAPALFEVHERSILELQAAQAEGRVTSRGLVETYLARIRAYDQSGPALNAVVTVNSLTHSPMPTPLTGSVLRAAHAARYTASRCS